MKKLLIIILLSGCGVDSSFDYSQCKHDRTGEFSSTLLTDAGYQYNFTWFFGYSDEQIPFSAWKEYRVCLDNRYNILHYN
ncbi:MAG: hypothetical protein WD267_10165 [Balneolales bacterium]